MKRSVFYVLILCTILIITACSKDTAEYELYLDDLVSEDGSYGWNDIAFGSGIENVEKALDIEFPSIPYFSDEWACGILPSSPDQIFDYRNDPNYESVEYAAYNETPLLFKYGDYRAHLVFNFSHGELRQVYLIFGRQAGIRDSKMDYGGHPNDIDAVFHQLKTDLDRHLGACTYESLNEYGTQEPSYRWDSDIDIGDGYTTRVTLYRDRRDDSEYDSTLLIINRIRFQDGEWQS